MFDFLLAYRAQYLKPKNSFGKTQKKKKKKKKKKKYKYSKL